MWPDDIVPLLHRKVDEVQPNDWIILANSFFHILDNPFAFVAYCKLINIFLNISLKYVPQESLSPERPLQRSVAASWLRQGSVHSGLDEQSAIEKAYANILP